MRRPCCRPRHIGAAVHDHVASAELGHQRRVAVEHLEVAVLRGQLDGCRRMLEEGALGSDEPDAELVCFVCHECSFQFQLPVWSSLASYMTKLN